MAKRAVDLAKLIFEAEPDSALGDPAAVERVSQALAKITGAILATILVRHGEEALGDAVRTIARTVELEARSTASMIRALDDGSGDPPTDTIN
jgi:hypothetical protein